MIKNAEQALKYVNVRCDNITFNYSPDILEIFRFCKARKLTIIASENFKISGEYGSLLNIILNADIEIIMDDVDGHDITISGDHEVDLIINVCSVKLTCECTIRNLLCFAVEKYITCKNVINVSKLSKETKLEITGHHTSNCDNIRKLIIRLNSDLDAYHVDAFNTSILVMNISDIHEIDLSRFNFDKVKNFTLNGNSPIIVNNSAFKCTTTWKSMLIKDFIFPFMPKLKHMYISKSSYYQFSSIDALEDKFDKIVIDHRSLVKSLTRRQFQELKLVEPNKNEYIIKTIEKAIYSNAFIFQNIASPDVKITITQGTDINVARLIRLLDKSDVEVKSARKV